MANSNQKRWSIITVKVGGPTTDRVQVAVVDNDSKPGSAGYKVFSWEGTEKDSRAVLKDLRAANKEANKFRSILNPWPGIKVS